MEVNVDLIHKSNVCFDFFEPEVVKNSLGQMFKNQMRHGDVYIYQHQLILKDNGRWFRVHISDIVKIKPFITLKQLIIRVGWFDIVLFCNEQSQAVAISNFLKLAIKYNHETQHSQLHTPLGKGPVYHKIKVKVPAKLT
jgi:hypothetical protein